MGREAYCPSREPQRLAITVEFLIGPYEAQLAERVRHRVVEELFAMGTEVTTVRVELTGQTAAW